MMNNFVILKIFSSHIFMMVLLVGVMYGINSCSRNSAMSKSLHECIEKGYPKFGEMPEDKFNDFLSHCDRSVELMYRKWN